jgi:ribose transport system substrate-binding protein
MSIKKVWSLILCLALVLSLIAGCATAATTTAKPAATTAAATTVAATTAAATTAAATTAAVTTAAATTAAATTAATKKTVAYLTPSTTIPFWNWVEEGVKTQCTTYGWNMITYDSKDSATTQLANAQNAITRKVDAIVISPTDSASCPAVLSEAAAAKVPVVICDIGTVSGEYLSYVATPNFDGAYQVGQYVAKYILANKLALGPVAEITVPLARINGQNRQKGFKKAMDEAGIKMTTTLESKTFTLDEAVTQTKNIITANPGLVCLWAHHSQASLGAVSALQELGMTGKVLVAAFDGDPDVVNYLQTGKILVCGAQQPKRMGRESVVALKTKFDGGTPQKEISIPVLLLTKDNVASNLTAINNDVCGLK